MNKRHFLLCFYLFANFLSSQEVVKTSFPVRLTPEEEAAAKLPPKQQPCCPIPPPCCEYFPPVEPTPCPTPCCAAPTQNCPPIMPRCNPCDCIMDYYNPIIYNGWDLSVELLVWTVQQKSSTFVLSPNGINQPFPASNQSVADSIGKYHSASFDWSPGVRIALGYTFERDAWNLLGQYTFYGTSGSDTVHRPSNPSLFLEPTSREVNLSPDGVDEMKSQTRFRYQEVNLLLSRRFLPGCQILLNFFAGPSAAWLNEHWKVKGTDIAHANPNVETKTASKWSFGGGGMRAGLDANWHMGAGFGLFNKLSLATYVGAYSNTKKTQVNATGAADPLIDSLLRPNVWNTTEEEVWVVPATQLEFGINWNHQFCRWAIALQGAFEVNTWYDLHQYHQADGSGFTPANHDKLEFRNTSPVSLWGATGRVNFSF